MKKIVWLLFAVASCPFIRAQDLEPRAYSNTPVGLNFFVVGYGHTNGNVSFDPSVPITDAHLKTNSGVFGYACSFGVLGRSAKFDIVAARTHLEGDALFQGQLRERNVTGWTDPLFRFSVNFFGAPALSMKDFAKYRQNLIMGFSLRVQAPFGQYDKTRLVNIGTNRWAIKSEVGVSKAWGRWTVDAAPSVTFYTNNTEFYNGGTVEQEPLYAIQGHVIYSFHNGFWVALDSTYYNGARTITNGVKGDNLQANTRTGLTVALPVNRKNSIKLNASTGTSTRTGSDFDAFGASWQYRWGKLDG